MGLRREAVENVANWAAAEPRSPMVHFARN